MLFHTHIFLFLFLPVVFACLAWARCRFCYGHALTVLLLASLIFYATWSLPFLPVLAAMLLGNWLISKRIIGLAATPNNLRGRWLTLGIGLNIAVLLLFKFLDVVAGVVAPGQAAKIMALAPHPIGLSFIVFIQIGYLVEVFNGRVTPPSAQKFSLFSLFFPYVTSGPIVSATDTLEQFEAKQQRLDFDHIASAITLLAIGLFKKLVIADSLAPYADQVFEAAATGASIGAVDAWFGAMLYMLQLYFDFSGYSDMAVALGYLFGIRLPMNFNSPFKATNATDYWRRWHITLTQFITNYIYMPLAIRAMRWSGQRRLGAYTQFLITVALPLLITFAIAGVWHGSGWTYLLYGLWWSLALTLYHAWTTFGNWTLPKPCAWLLTMTTALGALVLFRAPDLGTAGNLLAAGVGLGSHSTWLPPTVLVGTLVLSALVVTAPNSQELMGRYAISADSRLDDSATLHWWHWRPTGMGAALTSAILLSAVLMAGGPTYFLYYKF